MIYLCVDGGQTKTAASLVDEGGECLDSWEQEPLIHPSQPSGLERLTRVIRAVCEARRPRLERTPVIACFSLSGYHEGDDRVPALVEREAGRSLPRARRIVTIPDYVGNWYAATRGRPGIVIVSGGGSVVYGRDGAGRSLRVGGWGRAFGDEGSAYWIGVEAVKAALAAPVGLVPASALADEVMRRFRAKDELEFLDKVYSGSLADGAYSSLVPTVVSLAEGGDEVADGILDEAARHLAAMGASTIERLGRLPVHLSGGVFRAPTMQGRFEKALTGLAGEMEVAADFAYPAEGIFLVARKGTDEGGDVWRCEDGPGRDDEGPVLRGPRGGEQRRGGDGGEGA